MSLNIGGGHQLDGRKRPSPIMLLHRCTLDIK
jgi:hypothetical protein